MDDLQTFVLDDNKHEIIERISASGILYVTVDHDLLHTLTFKDHVKVHIVFDNQKLSKEQHEIQGQHNLCPKLEIEQQSSFDNSIVLSDNANMHLKVVDDIKETVNSFANHENSTYTGNYRLNNVVDTISTCNVPKFNNNNFSGLAMQNFASPKTSISRSNSRDNQSIKVANDLNCNPFYSAPESEDMNDVETFDFSPSYLTSNVNVSVTRSSESEISSMHSSESEGSFPYPNTATASKHTPENHLLDMESCENVKSHSENVTADAYFSQEKEDDTQSSESSFLNNSEKGSSTSETEIISVDKISTTKRRRHYAKPSFCQYCSLFFKNDLDLYSHTKVDKQTFPCLKCKQVFRYKAFLLVHNMTDHKEGNHFNNASSTANSQNHSKELASKSGSDKSNPNNITCEMCPKNFRNISQLKTHTMIHTGENVCPLFKCCVCDEKFLYFDSLKLHMKTHSVNDISTITNTTVVRKTKSKKKIRNRKKGNDLIDCKECNISFNNRAELARHQLTHLYKCHLCDSVFPNKITRNNHYQTFHKDDNNIIKCRACKRLFTCKNEYSSHIRHHNCRKKIQCPECGVFVLRLKRHFMTAHSTDNASLYVCDKCPKQFKVKSYLKKHLKSHIDVWPYHCDVCPKQFKLSHDLSKHMLTHSGEKPFVCEICGKTCNRRSNLKTHMQVHQKTPTFLTKDFG